LAAYIEQLGSPGSQFAMGGLLLGIGTLDAEEVLRYMDATFRQRAEEESMAQGSKASNDEGETIS
jgi:hypothetical protein